MPGVRQCQSIVGKGCISMPMVCKVRHANRAVSLHRERHVARPAVASARVDKPGIEIDRVSGPAEPQTAAKSVPYGHAFHAPAKAGDKPTDLRHGMRDPTPVQILVSNGHDFLALGCPECRHAVRALGIEEVGSGKIQYGVEKCALVALCFKGKSPAAIAGLDGLVAGNDGANAVPERVIPRGILACGHFQADAERYVTAAFPAEQPGPGSDRGIADPVSVEIAGALVAVGYQDGQAAGQAPSVVQLIVDRYVEQMVVILNLVVIEFPLHLLGRTDEMP